MSNELDQPTSNVLATISAVLGVLSVLGSGCCCVPIVSYLAMVIVPMLALGAIVTGFVGRSQVENTGAGGTESLIGIVGGFVSMLLGVGLFLVSIFAGVGFAMLGNL